jgi:hypothetical protein
MRFSRPTKYPPLSHSDFTLLGLNLNHLHTYFSSFKISRGNRSVLGLLESMTVEPPSFVFGMLLSHPILRSKVRTLAVGLSPSLL